MCVFPRFQRGQLFTPKLQYDEDIGRATGAGEVHEDFISNLSRITQLTGNCLFGDCFYMHLMSTDRVLGPHLCRGVRENPRIRYRAGYAILLHIIFCKEFTDRFTDVLLVNQTSNTLQNLCVDFATLGDLKIVERPTVYTVGPNGFQNIKATIKVSSTETGVIFGSILWDAPDLSEQAVILSDIHVDIMDYIKPAYCTEAQACPSLVVYFAFKLGN
jgi:coatomer subunit beta